MMRGGFGSDLSLYTQMPPLSLDSDFRSFRDGPGLEFQFTPRASGSLFAGEPGALTPGSERLSLRLEDRRPLSFDSFSFVRRGESGQPGLTVGGALAFDDWTIVGGVGMAGMLGGDGDIVSAGVEYGPVEARLVYGQLTGSSDQPGEVVRFSTDLAAWSWLTLEGDLAYGEEGLRGSDTGMAAGRLGVRLRF